MEKFTKDLKKAYAADMEKFTTDLKNAYDTDMWRSPRSSIAQ